MSPCWWRRSWSASDLKGPATGRPTGWSWDRRKDADGRTEGTAAEHQSNGYSYILRLQRIYEYPFDWCSAAVPSVLPSASLRLSQLQPVGRPVAGPFKSLALHERLHQQGLISVAPFPIRS